MLLCVLSVLGGEDKDLGQPCLVSAPLLFSLILYIVREFCVNIV